MLIAAGALTLRNNTLLKFDESSEFIIGVYSIIAGCFAIVIESKDVPALGQWAPFMSRAWGRGGFYVFWGILVAGSCAEINVSRPLLSRV